MSLLLSVFLVLVGAVDGTLNESTQTPDEVMQLEQRFTTALLKRDDIEFNELLAEDLVHIGFEGQIGGKAHRQCGSRYRSNRTHHRRQ